MKHSNIHNILSGEIERIGLRVSSGIQERLVDCLEYLHPTATRFGLTNYTDFSDFTTQLVCPALWLLHPQLGLGPASPLLDFGAGSGAVGIALAVLLPDVEVLLADRRARVVQFIDLAARRLSLTNCTALKVDLGNPPSGLVGSVGTVLIRAFGPTDNAIIRAERLIRPNGALALWHQPPPPPPPAGLTQAGSLETNIRSLTLTIYQHTT